MTFRERIKRAFKSSSPTSSLRKSSSQKSDKTKDASWPSNVYAPGEPMPRPKYRAPVKKEHKEKLDAFNWGDAWRRRSFMSEYSPMGSRMPSRRGSLLSRKSFGGKSVRRGSIGEKSTRGSTDAKGQEIKDEAAPHVKSRHAARATRLSAEIEAEGDDDVTNVGLSRVQSRERGGSLSRQLSADNAIPGRSLANGAPTENHLDSTLAHPRDHNEPFTEEELVLAMKRSHLTVPTQS